MTLNELLANPKPWLTTAEVASIQGLETKTIAVWCKQRRIESIRVGGTYRIPIRVVLEACGIDPASLLREVAA